MRLDNQFIRSLLGLRPKQYKVINSYTGEDSGHTFDTRKEAEQFVGRFEDRKDYSWRIRTEAVLDNTELSAVQ